MKIIENQFKILMTTTSYPQKATDWRGVFIKDMTVKFGQHIDVINVKLVDTDNPDVLWKFFIH